MAYASSTDLTKQSDSFIAKITGAVANFMSEVMIANSRSARVEKLYAMSDAELAEMNLRRDDVVRYVFRDCIA